MRWTERNLFGLLFEVTLVGRWTPAHEEQVGSFNLLENIHPRAPNNGIDLPDLAEASKNYRLGGDVELFSGLCTLLRFVLRFTKCLGEQLSMAAHKKTEDIWHGDLSTQTTHVQREPTDLFGM